MRPNYLIPALAVSLVVSAQFGKATIPLSIGLLVATVAAIFAHNADRRNPSRGDSTGDTGDGGFWGWGDGSGHSHDGGSHGDGGGHGGGDGGGGDGGGD